jgi:pimeloyl-ACP methyl ester carboxylesterase
MDRMTATVAPTPTVVKTATALPTAPPLPTKEPTAEPAAVFEPARCPFGVPDDVVIECGFVVVPEDHTAPSAEGRSRTIRLAVAIVKDRSDDHQPDPVILLSGGPGEKTVHNAGAIAQQLTPVHPNRDLIIFDQRGVGLSEPALECPEVVQAGFELLGETDPDIILQTIFDAILACRDRLVNAGYHLSAYTTVQNAADVNAIRVALGYEQINLWGGSYGSLLAQAVVRDHPQGIRSVAINSVLPLEKSLFVEGSVTTTNAVMRLLDACASDPACGSAYPDLEEVLFDVIDRLNETPVPITVTDPLDGQSYASMLTGDEVFGNLVTFLYFTEIIPVLPQAIQNVQDGDYALMTQLSSTKLALFDLLSRGMMYSVMCTDDLIGRTPQDLLNIRAALPRQLQGNGDPELMIEHGIFGICENWPVEQGDPAVKQPLVSDIPTLVLTGEFDPVTPPEYGQLVAGYLSNSSYFELPGIGHDILGASECARGIIGAFIAEPDETPDGACIAEMQDVAFAVPGAAEEIVLEPYTNEALGIQALVPAGWDEVQRGIFARGSPAVDMAVLQLAVEPASAARLLVAVTQNYGLAETPESSGERQANGLTWSLYSFEAQNVPRDLALAEWDGQTLIVILRSDRDEREALYEAVFLSVLDGFMPIE